MSFIGSTTAYPVGSPGGADRIPYVDAGTGVLKQALVSSMNGAVNVLTPVAGVVTIDCSLGDYFTLSPTANVTSILFTNLPGSGRAATKWIEFTQDTTPRTVAWPASFKWAGGSPGAVSTASGAIDEIAITTLNNGTAWKATIAKAFA